MITQLNNLMVMCIFSNFMWMCAEKRPPVYSWIKTSIINSMYQFLETLCKPKNVKNPDTYFSTALPYFVHGVSSTSIVGLFLWIFGYLIDFSRSKSKKRKVETKAREDAKKLKIKSNLHSNFFFFFMTLVWVEFCWTLLQIIYQYYIC